MARPAVVIRSDVGRVGNGALPLPSGRRADVKDDLAHAVDMAVDAVAWQHRSHTFGKRGLKAAL